MTAGHDNHTQPPPVDDTPTQGLPKPYGKIYRTIYDGTLAEDWRALVTMQQLIVLADWNGIVDMTASAIARYTGIPLDIIGPGIKKLEAADPESRTAADEGRRIERIGGNGRSWGWRLVNFEQYRDDYQATRREYQRLYMRRYRRAGPKRKKGSKGGAGEGTPPTGSPTSPAGSACPKPPATAASPEPAPPCFKFDRRVQIPADFCISDRVREWCAKNKFHPKPEDYLDDFVNHFQAKGTRWKDWDLTFINWIRDSLPGGKYYRLKPGEKPPHEYTPPADRQQPSSSHAPTRQELKIELRHAEDMIAAANDDAGRQAWQKYRDEIAAQIAALTTDKG